MSKRTSVISGSPMYSQVCGFPEQIEEALAAPLPEIPATDKICICGIGSSSTAGEILSDYIDAHSRTPISVVRGIDLPNWVRSDTIAIVMSYSGNTTETLYMYKGAKARKCTVVCMTSGGKLEKLCSSSGDILVKLPEGLSSRGALGYMLGYLMSIFRATGVCDSVSGLSDILPALKAFRDTLSASDSNRALSIAKKLIDKVPVIYSLSNMKSAAIRWKSQINENSKMIAFRGMIPEFNHNELIGWTEDDVTVSLGPVFLYDMTASDVLKDMTDTSMELLRARGLQIVEYRVDGATNLERSLKCIILGDFVSLYLAYLKKADPTATDAIDNAKETLAGDADGDDASAEAPAN